MIGKGNDIIIVSKKLKIRKMHEKVKIFIYRISEYKIYKN